MKRLKKPVRRFPIRLLLVPFTLSIIGLFFVFEASSVRGFGEYADSLHYVKLQGVWILLGSLLILFFSLFDYHKLYYLSLMIMTLTLVFLLLVLIPGIGYSAGGARRWIDLGVINIQPTELAKFSVIIYLSSWFIHRERKRFFSFLILLGALMFLIVLQPDIGTAIIVFLLSVLIYYLAGYELHYLLFLSPVAAVVFYLLVKFSPYRLKRFMAFFDPSVDPLGITYHINQILISLGNGGLFGQGIGISRQKFLFLPEAHTDSIFAIIGEEFGFIGALVIIGMYLYLLYLLYKIAVSAADRFGKLLAGGIFAFFNLQIIINLTGITNLLPLTGVPLPFISYGGSNLLISFILVGIAINIAKYARVYD